MFAFTLGRTSETPLKSSLSSLFLLSTRFPSLFSYGNSVTLAKIQSRYLACIKQDIPPFSDLEIRRAVRMREERKWEGEMKFSQTFVSTALVTSSHWLHHAL